MSREYFLVQKIMVGENEVIIEHLHSCAYIETASMDGVKIILELVDHAGVYQDDYELVEEAEFEVTFADPNSRGEEVWIETFIVSTSVKANGLLTINGFAKSTKELKQPALSPRFFVNKQPRDILAALLPELKVDADSFEKSSTYHLNAGGTPSRLIRSMARDHGSVCFICRGTVYFKSIKKLSLDAPNFTLECGNPSADHSIARYTKIGESELYKRVLNKSYVRWDTVAGIEKAKGGSEGALTMISVPQSKALNNQHIYIVPVLDVEMIGNTQFMPLKTASVLFHKMYPSAELDESLPEQQIFNQVSHYQRGNRYLCRVELGVKNA